MTTHRVPTEGSRLRALYDAFSASPGLPIPVRTHYKCDQSRNAAIEQLRNFYGMHITRSGPGRYCLIGEWRGNEYIEYVKTKE